MQYLVAAYETEDAEIRELLLSILDDIEIDPEKAISFYSHAVTDSAVSIRLKALAKLIELGKESAFIAT